jgi:chemotaxis protein MotB
MAGDGKSLQPIIIKRIKKSGHAAHGGAWKIAYADFVTAMMAFFLLMWLLGSTATGDLQGIASYFNQPLKVSLMGGSGSGDSTSIVPGGGADIRRANGQVNKTDGTKTRQQMRQELKAARAELAKADAARLRELETKINEVITANPRLAEYRSQIRIDLTPEGLRIQIVDEQNRPMFDVGSALVKPYMRDILREIGAALVGVENRISLAGHTDHSAYGNGERGYSNWELSSDRANASRRELVAGGMPDAKVFRVLGLASSDLFDPSNPLNPVNRRISIIVMSQEAEERLRTGIDARLREAEAEAAEAAAASSPALPGR